MKRKKIGNWDSLEEFVQSKRRLDLLSNGVWECMADPPGAMHRWFNPQLFEQLCVLDKDLEKLIARYQDTPEYRKKVENKLRDIGRRYLSLVARKFEKLLPGLVDYFETLYTTGEWSADKKTYAQYPKRGIEPADVKTERFVV